MIGQIFDRGGSPNDPVFITHHTMIDCIFDEWLQRYPDQGYPDDIPLTISTQGHQEQSYMVPFFRSILMPICLNQLLATLDIIVI